MFETEATLKVGIEFPRWIEARSKIRHDSIYRPLNTRFSRKW
jgi:hypothetical protein